MTQSLLLAATYVSEFVGDPVLDSGGLGLDLFGLVQPQHPLLLHLTTERNGVQPSLRGTGNGVARSATIPRNGVEWPGQWANPRLWNGAKRSDVCVSAAKVKVRLRDVAKGGGRTGYAPLEGFGYFFYFFVKGGLFRKIEA